jgi:chromate reductase
MRVLGISGSLREDSYNSRLLDAAAALMPPGAELVRFAGLKSIPPFDEDDEAGPPHPQVARLRQQIAAADGLLIATPEYNHSLPGQLKNAIDWASRPSASSVLRNKNAAVIGASTSMFGAVWAQAEARKVLAATGARVLDRELPVALAGEQFDQQGRLRDRDLKLTLSDILGELRAEIEHSRAAAVAA